MYCACRSVQVTEHGEIYAFHDFISMQVSTHNKSAGLVAPSASLSDTARISG